MLTLLEALRRDPLRLRALCGFALIACVQLGVLFHHGAHDDPANNCPTCTVLEQSGDALPAVELVPDSNRPRFPLARSAPRPAAALAGAAYHARAPPGEHSRGSSRRSPSGVRRVS